MALPLPLFFPSFLSPLLFGLLFYSLLYSPCQTGTEGNWTKLQHLRGTIASAITSIGSFPHTPPLDYSHSTIVSYRIYRIPVNSDRYTARPPETDNQTQPSKALCGEEKKKEGQKKPPRTVRKKKKLKKKNELSPLPIHSITELLPSCWFSLLPSLASFPFFSRYC